MMNLDNSYDRLPEDFHAMVEPDAVAAPSILAWNKKLAVELDLDSLADDEADLARIFIGEGDSEADAVGRQTLARSATFIRAPL